MTRVEKEQRKHLFGALRQVLYAKLGVLAQEDLRGLSGEEWTALAGCMVEAILSFLRKRRQARGAMLQWRLVWKNGARDCTLPVAVGLEQFGADVATACARIQLRSVAAPHEPKLVLIASKGGEEAEVESYGL